MLRVQSSFVHPTKCVGFSFAMGNRVGVRVHYADQGPSAHVRSKNSWEMDWFVGNASVRSPSSDHEDVNLFTAPCKRSKLSKRAQLHTKFRKETGAKIDFFFDPTMEVFWHNCYWKSFRDSHKWFIESATDTWTFKLVERKRGQVNWPIRLDSVADLQIVTL